MNKKSANAFFIVSLVVSVLLVVGACLGLYLYAQDGRKRAEASFERLTDMLAQVQSPEDLGNPILRMDLAAFYRDSPSLLLISVYERGKGVMWRLPASSEYLPASQNSASIPQPSYPANSSILFSAPLRSDPTGSLAVDALYVSLSQGRVFSVLRDLCLALAAYLAIACIVLFIGSLRSGRKAEAGVSLGEGQAAADGDGLSGRGFPYTDSGSPFPDQQETAEQSQDNENPPNPADFSGAEAGSSSDYPRVDDDFSIPDIPSDDNSDSSLPPLPGFEEVYARHDASAEESADTALPEAKPDTVSADALSDEAPAEIGGASDDASSGNSEDSTEALNMPEIDEGQAAEAEAGAMASVLAAGSGLSLSGDGAAEEPADGGQTVAAATKAGLKSGEGLYSPLSGLGWESYLHDRLEAELARSASFEQDLSLLFVNYEGLSPEKPEYKAMASLVGQFFTFKDLAFERGSDGFAVVMPNVDADHALKMAEEFLKQLETKLGGTRNPLDYMPVFIGVSSRCGRLVDSARISREAEAALAKARQDRDTHIVAFKPDPDKYRHYLSLRS